MQSTQRLRWLIASQMDCKIDVLTLDEGGGRILPVFSFREEAELYARLQIGSPRWQPRVFSAGEIVSLLYGPLADVTSAALDPLPEVCDSTALCLLCVRRRTFVRSLLQEGRDGASRRGHKATPEALPREPRYAAIASRVASGAASRGTAADPSSM
jgi:hypothetical protein